MEREYQRNLTGPGREEREEVCRRVEECFDKLFNKKSLSQGDESHLEAYYQCLCEDISRERARIGGDWVIAGVLLTKQHRDLVR